MKYFLLAILLSLSFFSPALASEMPIEITVTEKIPGLDCKSSEKSGNSPSDRKYDCTLADGAASLNGVFRGLLKYATYLTGVLAILMLVISGILYMFSGYSDEAKAKAKSLLTMVISGFILLYLVGFILNTLAPYVYGP